MSMPSAFRNPFIQEDNLDEPKRLSHRGTALGFVSGFAVCACLVLGWVLLGGTSTTIAPLASQRAESTWPLCNMNGVWTQDTNQCECYQCITGTNCTVFTPEGSCRITATSGQPYLMQEIWNNMTQGQAPPWYGTPANWRGPYQNPTTYRSVSPTEIGLDAMLNREIRALHAKYNNIVLDANDAIIITTGATQFWSAAMWGIAKGVADSGGPVQYVFERTPFYFGHDDMVEGGEKGEILNWNLLRWNTSYNLPANQVIEVLTQPSNPLGDFYSPIYPTPNRIYDLVYYWPHLAPVTTPFNENVMFFSLTKLSGHAGTRFGWGVVKNAALATRTANYISRNNLGPSVDIKWRAYNIMKDILNSDYVPTIEQAMKSRWVRIMAWFNSQKRFELLSEPNTAYIYARCLVDNNCALVFTSVGIDGIPGTSFGDSNSIYRINLTLHSYAFDLLMQKLYRLTSMDSKDQDNSQLPPAPILPEHISEYMEPVYPKNSA